MAPIITLPDAATSIASTTVWATPLFQSLFPVALIVAGLLIGGMVVGFIVGAIIGAVASVFKRRKGKRRRR